MDAGTFALALVVGAFLASLLPAGRLRPLRAGVPCPRSCSAGCEWCGRFTH